MAAKDTAAERNAVLRSLAKPPPACFLRGADLRFAVRWPACFFVAMAADYRKPILPSICRRFQSYARFLATAFFRTSFIRVCQPGPSALKASITALS